MKRITFLLLCFLSLTIQAQNATNDSQKKVWPSFLTTEQMPDGTLYLPAPPAFESQEFVGDIIRYHWGKSFRETPRGQQAIREAEMNTESLLTVFSQPIGMKLSTDKTPELAVLVSFIITDASNATRKAKNHFNRLRPFLYFNEGTLIPAEEESHHTPSYPSSHSATGWTVALVLTELLPERAELILKAGYEYGQSRVIAGYHYQSDVDVARLAASACVARLHADENFQKQLAKAKKELQRLRVE